MSRDSSSINGSSNPPSEIDIEGGKAAAAVTATEDRARLRQAADDLRECGIPNADKVIRLGAAAMVQRCIARFGDQPRLLARVILDGGVIYDDEQPAARAAAREENDQSYNSVMRR